MERYNLIVIWAGSGVLTAATQARITSHDSVGRFTELGVYVAVALR